MVDVLERVAADLRRQPVSSPIPNDEDFVIATLHRADNTDDPVRLRAIFEALGKLPLPTYLAAHPRLRDRCLEFGLEPSGSIRLIAPLRYPQMVQTVGMASAVVTDSGGLQKEAFILGTPTVTVRSETEWAETLVNSWNVLVSDPAEIPSAVARPRPETTRDQPFGSGDASERVVAALTNGTRS